MPAPDRPRLFPSQVCFVVDDVPSAARRCRDAYGWGPFTQFTAKVEDGRYRDWRGAKRTEVALGMAGRTQVELIHVHEGRDSVADYQTRYGRGFQHLGVGVSGRAETVRFLETLGARVNEQLDVEGLEIAFVDLPTGPAMFELLAPVGEPAAEYRMPDPATATGSAPPRPVFGIQRATIATDDLDRSLAFHAAAFGWSDARPQTRTLRHPAGESTLRRFRGRAGTLELELVESDPAGEDPYALHLRRGPHGLVHAGGPTRSRARDDAPYHWLEDGEAFSLDDWEAGPRALQCYATGD